MTPVPPLPLAQSFISAENARGVVVWSIALVLLVVVGFVAYTLLRRWMRGGPDEAGPARGFTLADVRAMHRRGELSDAEFAATKAELLGSAKAAADRMPPVLPRPHHRPPVADPPDETSPAEEGPAS